MKFLKNIFIIILLVYTTIVSALFFGNNTSTKKHSLPLTASKNTTHIESTSWATFEEFYVDINNDGLKDCIKLQVNATKDSHGNFEWNDGQKWALNIYTKKTVYTLYQNFLQFGNYHMIIGTDPADSSDNPRIKIGLVNINHCGISLESFTYSNKLKKFIKNPDSSSINMNTILFSKLQ